MQKLSSQKNLQKTNILPKQIPLRKSLSSLAGILSEKTADRLEKAIKEARIIRNKAHQTDLKGLSKNSTPFKI